MAQHIAFACLACGQVDDDPKHVIAMTADTEVRHHHDCGALMNPPCPVCTILTGEAPVQPSKIKGAPHVPVTGQAMRDHLLSLPPRAWTHHPDGSVTYTDNPEPVTGGEG